MRRIEQHEAEQMRETLKEIAGYYNESAVPGPAQKAAEKARKTLEDLKLLYQTDAHSDR